MIGESNFFIHGPAYIDNTGDFGHINSNSLYSESGSFNYLGPTGLFFPPQMTFSMRTGLWSGISTPSGTHYDGLLVFQIGDSGQALMTVQSGVWKTLSWT